MLEVVDYGGGNLGSLQRCLQRLELAYRLTDAPSGEVPLVLPGVGAFGAVARGLAEGGLDARVKAVVKEGVPFLGICVGLQILLDSSQESPAVTGLGLIPGEVVRFQARKVPQIGWNKVTSPQGWPEGFVYFVNSYYAVPTRYEDVLYEADYEGRFCAAVRRDNLCAFQFHPEKSGEFGHQLLLRWAEEAI